MAPPKMKPVAAAAVAPRPVKSRPMGRGTFVPSVKLDPSQIADMRGFKPMSNPKTPGPYAGPAPIRPKGPVAKVQAPLRRPALKTAPGLKADKVGQVSKYPSSKEGKALSTLRAASKPKAPAKAKGTNATSYIRKQVGQKPASTPRRTPLKGGIEYLTPPRKRPARTS